MAKLPAKGEGKISHKSVYLRENQWRALADIVRTEKGYSEAEIIRHIVDLGLKAYFGENLDKK